MDLRSMHHLNGKSLHLLLKSSDVDWTFKIKLAKYAMWNSQILVPSKEQLVIDCCIVALLNPKKNHASESDQQHIFATLTQFIVLDTCESFKLQASFLSILLKQLTRTASAKDNQIVFKCIDALLTRPKYEALIREQPEFLPKLVGVILETFFGGQSIEGDVRGSADLPQFVSSIFDHLNKQAITFLGDDTYQAMLYKYSSSMLPHVSNLFAYSELWSSVSPVIAKWFGAHALFAGYNLHHFQRILSATYASEDCFLKVLPTVSVQFLPTILRWFVDSYSNQDRRLCLTFARRLSLNFGAAPEDRVSVLVTFLDIVREFGLYVTVEDEEQGQKNWFIDCLKYLLTLSNNAVVDLGPSVTRCHSHFLHMVPGVYDSSMCELLFQQMFALYDGQRTFAVDNTIRNLFVLLFNEYGKLKALSALLNSYFSFCLKCDQQNCSISGMVGEALADVVELMSLAGVVELLELCCNVAEQNPQAMCAICSIVDTICRSSVQAIRETQPAQQIIAVLIKLQCLTPRSSSADEFCDILLWRLYCDYRRVLKRLDKHSSVLPKLARKSRQEIGDEIAVACLTMLRARSGRGKDKDGMGKIDACVLGALHKFREHVCFSTLCYCKKFWQLLHECLFLLPFGSGELWTLLAESLVALFWPSDSTTPHVVDKEEWLPLLTENEEFCTKFMAYALKRAHRLCCTMLNSGDELSFWLDKFSDVVLSAESEPDYRQVFCRITRKLARHKSPSVGFGRFEGSGGELTVLLTDMLRYVQKLPLEFLNERAQLLAIGLALSIVYCFRCTLLEPGPHVISPNLVGDLQVLHAENCRLLLLTMTIPNSTSLWCELQLNATFVTVALQASGVLLSKSLNDMLMPLTYAVFEQLLRTFLETELFKHMFTASISLLTSSSEWPLVFRLTCCRIALDILLKLPNQPEGFTSIQMLDEWICSLPHLNAIHFLENQASDTETFVSVICVIARLKTVGTKFGLVTNVPYDWCLSTVEACLTDEHLARKYQYELVKFLLLPAADFSQLQPVERGENAAKLCLILVKAGVFDELTDCAELLKFISLPQLLTIVHVLPFDSAQVSQKCSLLFLFECVLERKKFWGGDTSAELTSLLQCVIASVPVDLAESVMLHDFAVRTLKFLAKVIVSKRIGITGHFAGLCLTVGSLVPLSDVTYLPLLELLNVLLVHRKEMVFGMIPSYLAVFKRLLQALFTIKNESLQLMLAHRLSRHSHLMAQHSVDFARVAPFIVADFLTEMQKQRVQYGPALRRYVNSALYAILALCDSHSLAMLSTNLSGDLKETFRLTLEDFQKFYEYKGFV